MLLERPEAADNPFYRRAPQGAIYPLVALATAATVIASQAVISGAFSLARQAVQLGYSPRVRIEHTSPEEVGQIYVSSLNWGLMLATAGLVLGLRSPTRLAAAYGVAVTGTMAITTVLFAMAARRRWRWSIATIGLLGEGSSPWTSPSSARRWSRWRTAGGSRWWGPFSSIAC